MRNLVALLVAVALAGCTGAPTDDAAPGPLPADAGGLPADPGADSMSSEAGDSGGTQPGKGVAPQQGQQEDTQSDLHLTGTMEACDAGYCAKLSASIEGLDSYYVSNICAPAHRDRMEIDGEPVQHREPLFYCTAFGVRQWEPREIIDFEYEWNGTIWDDAQNAPVAAPEGAYQWIIEFFAWDAPDGGNRQTLNVTFTVVIGQT